MRFVPITVLVLYLLSPLTGAAAPDAPTPAGPVTATSVTRAEIVLNGLWRWLPAAGPSVTSPAGAADWGLIWVPGVWGTRMWGHYKNAEPGADTPGVQKIGAGAEWKEWNETLREAWYEREVTVPAAWTGRAVILSFGRLATDAEIWLDGRHAGRVAWPGGELDLGATVRPGNMQRLRVRVTALQTAEGAIDYMGVGQNTSTRASLDLRGISGDVVLSSRPAGPRITDVFVKTSTRKQQLALDVELAGVKPGEALAITALVRSAADTVAPRTFTTAAVVAAAPDANAAPESTAVLHDLAWDWADARRWDTDDPFLHHLELQVRRASADDAVGAPLDAWGVDFGFREFWAEGRDFFLNGTRIHLRPALQGGVTGAFSPPEALAAELARWRENGRNFVEVWPAAKDRGARVPDASVAEAADHSGMLVSVPGVRINEFATGPGYRPIWNTVAGRDAWRPLFQADWRKLRNHPSIVMIGLSGNFGGHQHDQDPRWLGRRQMPPGQKDNLAQAEADEIAADFDPTRLRWHHQGGAHGDVFTVNHYLNFIPLQEREEWLSEWARSGDMPYAGVEFGTPFNASFLRGRDGFGNSIGSEPFLAEYAAIYLGSDAYRLQGEDYARAVRGRFEQPDPVRNGRWASWQNRPELYESPAFQTIQELFVTRTWRAWRTDGVSGGMIPWDDIYFVAPRTAPRAVLEWRSGRRGWFVPELPGAALRTSFHDATAYRLHPAGRALETVNGPTLAWLAGPPGRTHAKEPHVRSGGRVERQVVLINDTRAPQPFHARWHLEAGAVPSAGGEERGKLAPGEIRFLPVSFDAPDTVARGGQTDAVLVLDAEIGPRAHSDRQTIRVYGPATAEGTAQKIVLHDPEGRTARLLTRLGVAWTPASAGEKPPADALLILGRDALRESAPPLDLEAHVAEGGRVLLLAQSPDWVRRSLGLRVAPVPARRLYPVPTVAAELNGTDTFDLTDWNGEGTLLEARPEHALASPALPPFGWRWGNSGAVSSSMIEKPHRSGWTPLLEGEWDLAYSPWMELGHGRGRITWCTLDLEDQAPLDPAAERLARRVLALAARPVTTPRLGEAVYVGSEAGAAALRLAGLNFRTAKQPDAKAPLLIVDASTPLPDAQLENHARLGGTVVMLAQPGGDTPARLGVTIKLEKRYLGGVAPEGNTLTRGLSASDLRWRAPQDTWVLADGAALVANGLLGMRAVGKGRIVFIQIDPTAFDLEKRPFYKHTQWRLTRALTQVLANLGTTFAADRMIFAPQILRVELAGPWAVKFTRELPLAGWEKPHADPGISPEAQALLADQADTSGWERFALPANHPRFAEVSGEAVWRREVTLPASWAGETAMLHIPGIKSFDTVTMNGQVLGSTSKDTDPKNPNPWNTPRAYRIQPGVIRAGKNVIAIRQFVPDKDGGVHGRADRFYLQLLVPENRKLNAYVENWNDDPEYGDDPYRYYRW